MSRASQKRPPASAAGDTHTQSTYTRVKYASRLHERGVLDRAQRHYRVRPPRLMFPSSSSPPPPPSSPGAESRPRNLGPSPCHADAWYPGIQRRVGTP
eukprot:scaffold28961_cov65-Phaeocystis_antarctica.AAC.1